MTERQIVSTEKAPAAIGPYSQAVIHGNLVWTAGQIALAPGSGEMVGEGDVTREAEQVFRNLSAVLEAAGSGFEQVLRCEVYLADFADYGAVNEVYARFFGEAPPARVAIQAAALPKNARVEISCVAARHPA